MWPERNDNSWPQFCSGNSYSAGAISSIRGEMDTYWPNLQSHGTSDSFWKHEWEKHGTCAADGSMPGISDELSFFQYALDIHSSMPYAKTLAAYGVVPSNSQTYTLSQINQALTQTFNFTVIPSCMKSNGQYNLMRLYSCISKQGQLINCPPQVITGLNQRADCGNGQSIGMPPIQH
jgi:ribonuclease T2